MILPKEQINRYLRHIIMPEISGQGQKKIIESSVMIFADKINDAYSLVLYLSASGVGHITCCFVDPEGYEKLFNCVRDLNNDCIIELIEADSFSRELIDNGRFTLNIFLFAICRLKEFISVYPGIENTCESLPAVFAFSHGWKGFVRLVEGGDAMREIFSNIESLFNSAYEANNNNVFISYLLGAISAIELVKYALNLGSKPDKPLFIDLLSMEFSRDENKRLLDFFSYSHVEKDMAEEKNISVGESVRSIKELSQCRVLIVGTGGLGSPAALALAAAGIGTLGLVDYDSVELSNLNRQILHSASRIGMPKAESASVFFQNIMPDINIVTYNNGLNKDNVMDIIGEYDVVIDAVDNFPTRYLLNDACFFAGKPMIEAGVVKFTGLNMTIIPGQSTCYRCIFPIMPQAGNVQTCAEVGVLGPVPGAMGFIQAAETFKLLSGQGELLTNKIMYFDALEMDFDVISLDRQPKCELCGDSPAITELREYDFSCDSRAQ